MADVSLSTLRGEPRRKIVTLTASDAAVAIPSWAQGGKGIVYVTGCGGGASGAVIAISGRRGGGGGAGAYAMRHPFVIPSSTSTMSCTIGAGGAAKSSSAAVDGDSGGDTVLAFGDISLVLSGGLGGNVNAGATYKGVPILGSTTGIVRNQAAFVSSITTAGPPNASGLFGTLVAGVLGGLGQSVGGGFGAGGASPFGQFGAALAAGPTVNTNGDDATGYGAGGAGALWISGSAVTSGAGSPGFLTLEFVEGF